MAKTIYIDLISGPAGRWLLTKLDRIINQFAFFWLCLKALKHHLTSGRRIVSRIVVQQIYFTGVQSLELVAVIALGAGAVIVTGGIHQLSKLGSLEVLSAILIVTLIREIGPLFTAVIVILRSGSAITLEMGYMNVLGEIEGLEMQGISSLHFLCIPRLLGVTIAVICLIVLFDLIAVVGGFFAAWAVTGISVWNFLHSLAGALSPADFLVVTAKAICFGLIIPVVCLYNGFLAQGSITAVPPRVSLALVDCFIYCVLASVIISVVFAF